MVGRGITFLAVAGPAIALADNVFGSSRVCHSAVRWQIAVYNNTDWIHFTEYAFRKTISCSITQLFVWHRAVLIFMVLC